MKKTFYLFAIMAIAIVSFTGCSKDDGVAGTIWEHKYSSGDKWVISFITETGCNMYYENSDGAKSGRTFDGTYNFSDKTVIFSLSGIDSNGFKLDFQSATVNGDAMTVSYTWAGYSAKNETFAKR